MPPKKRKSTKKRSKPRAKPRAKPKEILKAHTESVSCHYEPSVGAMVCERTVENVVCTQTKKGKITCKPVKPVKPE